MSTWIIVGLVLLGVLLVLAVAKVYRARQRGVVRQEVRENTKEQNLERVPTLGEIAVVSEHAWVRVVNDSIESGNNNFDFGETGSINEGGTVRVLGIETSSNRVLVEYTTPDGELAYGACLPTGSQFFLTIDVFNNMTERYGMVLATREQERGQVHALRNQSEGLQTSS